jgi:hypothetical protein
MCRNIKTLFNYEPPATAVEIHEAALQYVRKVSGYRSPSAVNEAAFADAVHEVEATTAKLMQSLVTHAPPKDREAEEAKARARSKARFGRSGAV